MSIAFTLDKYGNAALMFASAAGGQLPATQPNGPNLVRWLVGGLLNLTTVNGSNLGRPVMTTYSHFSGTSRFTGGAFAQNAVGRIGPWQQFFPINSIYPTT